VLGLSLICPSRHPDMGTAVCCAESGSSGSCSRCNFTARQSTAGDPCLMRHTPLAPPGKGCRSSSLTPPSVGLRPASHTLRAAGPPTGVVAAASVLSLILVPPTSHVPARNDPWKASDGMSSRAYGACLCACVLCYLRPASLAEHQHMEAIRRKVAPACANHSHSDVIRIPAPKPGASLRAWPAPGLQIPSS